MSRRIALIGLLLLGCASTQREGVTEPARLDPRLQPAFEALKAAVDEGADEVARAILARLRPRCTDPLSKRVAEGYERILFGRYVRDSVETQAVVQQVSGGFSVGIQLRQDEFPRVEFAPGYAQIEMTTRSMDPGGQQSVKVEDRIVQVSEAWVLESGTTLETSLGVDSPSLGEGIIAVRCEWRVRLGAGSAWVSNERFPAQGFWVEPCVLVRLSRELPTGPVEPQEMIRYALGGEVHRAALLERAVRIPPERYEETLDLLSARQREFSPSMMKELVPALAWLTGSSGIEAAGEDWRAWLLARSAPGVGGGGLDLPDKGSR